MNERPSPRTLGWGQCSVLKINVGKLESSHIVFIYMYIISTLIVKQYTWVLDTRMRDLPPSSFIYFFYRTRWVIFVISSLPCINTPPPRAQITTFTVVSIILFFFDCKYVWGRSVPHPHPHPTSAACQYSKIDIKRYKNIK